MKLPLRLLLWLLACGALCVATSAFALQGPARRAAKEQAPAIGSSLENARRAQARLGPDTWSRVIRIENGAPRSIYPALVYALVFEEAGILWFYTDTDGTQSFSQYPDRMAEEKADFGPLLRAIDPGFGAYEILSSDVARVSRPVFENPEQNHGSGDPYHALLPNGCFVDSLAALRDRVRKGELVERARLLSCYIDTPAGLRGHTVLTYETPRGLFLLDATRSAEPRLMPREWADDAVALAGAALQGAKVARARWVPTSLPSPVSHVAAVDASSTDPASSAAPRIMR